MRLSAWIEKAALFLFTAFLTAFLVFCVFEFLPGVPDKIGLTRIYYYAIRDRYVKDESLVLRMRPGYSYEGLFEGDIRGLFSESSYKPAPYKAVYDKDGFRNKYTGQPADVVVLGDSYMEVGETNDETFAAYLEKIAGLKTANYGMGWYGPFQYLEVFKRYGMKNSPRFAVFSIFEGNDLKDTAEYSAWRKGGDYYHFNVYHSGNFLRRFFLCVKDTAKMFGKLLVRRWDPRRAAIRLSAAGRVYHTVFVYPVDTRPRHEISRLPELQELKTVLREFNAACQARQIKPLILFIPSKAHIYLPYAETPGIPEDSAQKQKQARAELESAVELAVKEAGLEWLSLTEAFENAAKAGEFVYYETDTHWNARGRTLAAELAAAKLKN